MEAMHCSDQKDLDETVESHLTGQDVDQESTDRTVARGHWSSQLDFVLSLIGYTVGYGNLWRFPYLCNKNGGGAFLIPFIFCLITCGLPLVFLETAIGQFAGLGAVHVWGVCPIFKGIGIGQYVLCTLSIVHYQLILAWCIYYMVMSCTAIVPWTTCNNEWNSDQCRSDQHYSNLTSTVTPNVTTSTNFTFANTDVEEYWQYKALGRSSGVHEIGGVHWHLAVSLLASWILIFLCLIKGVKSVGKVVYVTALLPYVLLLVLFIRTLLLPGSVDGIVYFIKPNFSKLARFDVWQQALIQVFFSVGPGWGILISMSSYNKFNYNFLRNSVIVTSVSEGTSLFAGFIIFTVLGFMANTINVDVADVTSSGPGLAFVAYPEGLSHLPLPQLWSFLFFFMMVTVGLDSQFTLAETLITAVVDQYPRKLRPRRTLVTGVACAIYFLLGLIYTTEGGIYYFQITDWYLCSVATIIFCILECVIFFWIYGSRRLGDDIEMMLGRRVPPVFNILLAYITPTFLTTALILGLINYKSPVYGNYVYPQTSNIAGWLLALLPVLPLPVMAGVMLFRAKGSFKQRLRQTLCPDETWKPTKQQELYEPSSKTKFSFLAACRA